MNYKNFQFAEDPFAKNAQGISKIHHEILLLMKFLQTKPQVESMNNNYYNLHYTVIKNRDEKEIVKDQYENNENDYISFHDFITPNHYIGRKNNSYYINRDAKMDTRKCDNCNLYVHRASYLKHLRSKKHLENEKQNELIIPELKIDIILNH